jgi:hypothetical protein
VRSEQEIRADAADDRPFSNHTEYEIWADRYCWAPCVHDDPDRDKFCPILSVALLGSWPKEWTRRHIRFGERIGGTDRVEVHETDAADPDGIEIVGECTEFEERPDPGDEPDPEPEPPPVCDGQLDLIDAYLDTALDELTPRMVPR